MRNESARRSVTACGTKPSHRCADAAGKRLSTYGDVIADYIGATVIARGANLVGLASRNLSTTQSKTLEWPDRRPTGVQKVEELTEIRAVYVTVAGIAAADVQDAVSRG